MQCGNQRLEAEGILKTMNMLKEWQMQPPVKTNFHWLNLRVYFKITLLKTVKICEEKHTLMCFRLNPTSCLVKSVQVFEQT